jgi:hypothetical protein
MYEENAMLKDTIENIKNSPKAKKLTALYDLVSRIPFLKNLK